MCMGWLGLQGGFSGKHHQERQELELEELVKHHPQAGGVFQQISLSLPLQYLHYMFVLNTIIFGDHNESMNRYVFKVALQTSPALCR